MASYPTIDYIRNLTPSEIKGARAIVPEGSGTPSYSSDNKALFYSSENYILLQDIFKFTGAAGATYSVISSSFIDPFGLVVYDAIGNAIAVDEGRFAYGYDHASFIAPYSGTYYISTSWLQGSSIQEKDLLVSVHERLGTVEKENIIVGTPGRDRIFETAGSDTVDGGGDIDTFVLGRQLEAYSVTRDGNVVTVADVGGLGSPDKLTNVERIQFLGGDYITFETEGIPGQMYRLYKLAFNRVPDKAGLGYWIAQMDQGMTLESVANVFSSSNEFKVAYGTTNSDIVAGMYENVLGRTPEAAGFDYWLNVLEQKHATVAQVLVMFSESPENQAQVIGLLQNGLAFTEFTGN